MSVEVQNQFYFFFLSAFWGIGMCFIYDGLRILRQLIHHSVRWINTEDILYWAAMTAVLFYLLFTHNRGEIRSYTIAGILLGSVFYSKTISPVWVALVCRVFKPFIRLFSTIRSFFIKIMHNHKNNH
ncbi:spore cortex biosynthesis protein YabQ [Frisingicoccus sp.]|uniref:spore cortex biosynthesis protein YabQ n=1 Tax=Frisingicoccus sp. TaxID=1918627 RepID=UPI002ECCAFE8|nr:spore cortex biosynthesis protein YabQ [Frisingicoccus sp.]